MTEWRWPVRECLHYSISFSITIRLNSGEVVNTIPIQCMDCGLVFDEDE